MRLRIIVSLGLAMACASNASAAEPMAIEVRAQLVDDGLRGTWRGEVRVAEGERGVRLWFYSERVADAPSAMNDRNARWVYPRERDLSELSVQEVQVDGVEASSRFVQVDEPERAREFAGVDLFIPMSPGVHQLSLQFRQRVPERFGRFGRVGSTISLSGPWYPLVLRGDESSRQDDGFAFNATQDVELCADGDRDVLLGATQSRGCARVETRGAYVPALVADTLHVRTERARANTPQGAQVEAEVRIISTTGLYHAPSANARGLERLHDLSRVDVVGNVVQVVRDVMLTALAAGLHVRSRVDVVLTPSRTELAATAPGWVLVSDRLYEIFPLEQVRALHDRALARSIFSRVVEPLGRHDEVADRPWANDVRAVLLTDLDIVRQNGELTTTEDLIGWAGFHPVVDQLLYAPQVAFVDVLFGSVAEPDPFRENPWRARRPTARGRRILEHARDLMDEDAFRAWSRSLLAGEEGAREALARVDANALARLPQWLRSPALEVNYRLGEVRSERTETGWRHTVTVHRDGAHRVEPVEVRVIDRDGHAETGIWDGESGETGHVVIETPARRRSVRIDPRSRLPQSPRLANGHPLRDDTDSLSFRPPIIQNLALSGSATELNLTGLLDVVVRRRYDTENTFGLRLTFDPRSYGGILRYVRGVGRSRDTNNRRGFVSLGLEVDRLRSSFAADSQGGWRFGLLALGGYSDQRFFLDPRRGRAIVGSLQTGFVQRDDDSTSLTMTPAIRGNYTLPLGLRGALVLVGGAAWVFGSPLASELPGLGGRFLLRGYQSDEAVGRGRFFAVAEARFTPTGLSDLAWNGLHLVWVREIQLAVFTGAGVVVDLIDGRSAAFGADVGGGLRVHFDYGGIQPAVLAVDLAVPLVRRASDRASRAPVTFVLGFEQFF